MPHKASRSFFDEKRPWSIRKDRILGGYLAAYLPKIATQRKPILIVDAFAGPGRFGDGSDGSPLIICKAIETALKRSHAVPMSCVCIEKDEGLFAQLHEVLANYPFASAARGTFIEHMGELADKAKTHNLFLYVDPFTVEGLVWDEMDRVFQMLCRAISIEILLNLNAASFVRRGLAALALNVPDIDPTYEDFEDVDAPIHDLPSITRLDRIVGGNWWQEDLHGTHTFESQVNRIAKTFSDQLRARFGEVCAHAMRAFPHHKIPKYYLIFGTRHPHGLRLMNDQMIVSRRTLADLAKPKEPTLFETRSEELVPDTSRIRPLVLRHSTTKQQRGELIVAVIRDAFCDFSSAEIRGEIEQLLKEKVLVSSTGKVRINDETDVWRSGSESGE
jgi:three-Cys-motif partner protein